MLTPDKAFILAAGLGTRMRPLTDSLPKPLMNVTGVSLLERTLDHLEKASVKDVVINTHHLADKITEKLKNRKSPHITYSHEDKLLDTGGGIKKMIHHFSEDPFYVLSGDGLWTDGAKKPALQKLAEYWNSNDMDILILLQPVKNMKLTEGIGDYSIDSGGRAIRSKDKTGDHMFTSIRINHPRIFKNAPEHAFSYLSLLDEAENKGRLFGLAHDDEWHHLSTPHDLMTVNKAFEKKDE